MVALDVVPFLELLLWFVMISALVTAVGFIIWTFITAVLWAVAHRRGEDRPQPLAADGWFEALEAQQ